MRIRSLQVLRAIAAILIALYHITDASQKRLGIDLFGGMFATSHTAVDLFLVLCGFVITYAHWGDIGRREKLGRYLIKRFIRLYPLYWLITAAKFALIVLLPEFAQDYQQGTAYIIKSFLLIPQEHFPLVAAAWILSYQILFYLLFGTVIALGRRWALLLLAVWPLAILSFEVSRAMGSPFGSSHQPVRFLLAERNLEFVLGSLAAIVVLKLGPKRGRAIALVGIALFALANVYLAQVAEVRFYSLYFGLPATMIVIGCASAELRRPVQLPRWLVYLGDSSYSIYLAHMMFFNVFLVGYSRLGFLETPALLLLSLALTVPPILGGTVLYRLVEKPSVDWFRAKLLSKPANAQKVVSPQTR